MDDIQKREEQIQVRVNQDEKSAIQEKSKKAGLTVSEFVRSTALGCTIREAPGGDFDRIIWELKKIGNNLNQIAHIANATNDIDAQKYHEDMAALKVVIRQLESVIFDGDS